MFTRRWKALAGALVLVVTAVLFVVYVRNHPEVGDQLLKTEPRVIFLLVGMHLGGVAALAGVMLATLRLCKLKLPLSEGLLLTAYSSVVNFFGPLQSGPAFRAVYLKARYNVNLKQYASATLMYYFFYGIFSGLMVLSGLHSTWILVASIAAVLIGLIVLRTPRVRARLDSLDLRGWYLLAAATLVQCVAVLAIYYVELRTIDPAISVGQAIVYTGAANLALFVSITPGAIGFRESFLVFTQQLHDVPNQVIVAASLLDRAVYVILLLILALFITLTHTKARLSPTNRQ
jgi:uncharacterized membrane protein YbhN (UPF0104 family)